MVCRVRSNLVNEEALAHWGLSRQIKKKLLDAVYSAQLKVLLKRPVFLKLLLLVAPI